MIGHDHVQMKLYEFLRDEVSPEERALIEAHLAMCDACANEMQEIRDALSLLPIPSQPSNERSAEFWNAFSSRTLEKLKTNRRNPFVDVVDWVREMLLLRPRYAYALSGALSLALVAIAFWTFSARDEHDLQLSLNSVPFRNTSTPVLSQQDDFAVSAERVNQYFRKSKTLLVGLANLTTDQNEPLDFSTERRVSRDLIREARFLKQQHIDPRSRRLMNDLEKILIELANIEEHNDLPNVEIVRGGIRQENLLFKIRMAEAMYDSSGFMYTNEQR